MKHCNNLILYFVFHLISMHTKYTGISPFIVLQCHNQFKTKNITISCHFFLKVLKMKKLLCIWLKIKKLQELYNHYNLVFDIGDKRQCNA